MKIELIEWVDSRCDFGWTPVDEVSILSHCYSVGIVVYEDDELLKITTTGDTTCDNVLSPIAIPVCAITRRRQLKVK